MEIIIGQVFIHTLDDAAARHQCLKLLCDRTARIIDKGTDDGIVTCVFPVADRLRLRIALKLQHIIHDIPRTVDIEIPEMVAIVPFLHVLCLFCHISSFQQLINLALYEAEILVETRICNRIRYEIICSRKDALFRDL